ncbi:MAG: hypothetical protein K2X93_26890 [Candidatus Obscuribacterales bacterium]|nr:hypothetical protein [Candidatus Obscuribacterales bacterium]
MQRLFRHPALYIAILALAVLVCFGRTLGSYHLADDFGEVAYVSKIFEGDLGRLWSNFTGNYMQVPSMNVYRPWLLMTLLIDYSIWRTDAFGYYLTNLLHYLSCAVLTFFIVKLLTAYWGQLRSTLTSIFSALLFAVNPLHCESVSWVVGRVDIVCLTYYLLGLLATVLYTRRGNKNWLWLLGGAFWMSILTKEMAIALPVTATVLAFLWGKSKSEAGPDSLDFRPDESRNTSSLHKEPGIVNMTPPNDVPEMRQSQHSASSLTAVAESPFVDRTSALPQPEPSGWRQGLASATPVFLIMFVSTVVYFAIRYSSLGTIGGGYTGSIGSSQFSGIIQKWADLDTVMRIVFPLNQFVFGDATFYRRILSAIYIALAALTFTRLLVGTTPRRWIAFIAVSGLTALAPIYQLWGIGYNLEGSRFVFFLTVALSMFFPVVLFAPLTRKNTTMPAVLTTQLSMKLLIASTVALMALVVTYGKITLSNNVPWVHAGKQTRAITVAAQALSSTNKSGKLDCVVGIPKDEGGAHMILNGNTFRHLVTPPFAPEGLNGKILTFEPMLFGDPDKIDTRHFRETLRRNDIRSYLRWDMNLKKFVPFYPGTPLATPQAQKIDLFGLTQESEGKTLPRSRAFLPYSEGRGQVVESNRKGLTVEGADGGLGIKLSDLHLSPAQYDYLAINIASEQLDELNGKALSLQILPKEGQAATVTCETVVEVVADQSRVLVPLSSFWRYYAFGEIKGIIVQLPGVKRISVKSIELLPDELVSPRVQVVGKQSASDGAFTINRRGQAKEPVRIRLDSSAIANADKVSVQILKRDFFFDNLHSPGALLSGIDCVLTGNGKICEVSIPDWVFEKPGYVQLRAICLDNAKRTAGTYSLPITLRVLAD